MKTDFRTEESENEHRLDTVLAKRFPEISRAAWKKKIADGDILVNGRPAKKSLLVHKGQSVAVALISQLAKQTAVVPNAGIALPVVFEDEHILAVAKPPNIPSHPLSLEESQTALNGIVALAPQTAVAGDIACEGGLVHRLDNETSGILVAAKTPEAFASLRALFRSQQATKTYLAIVVGELKNDCEVEFPIAHHASHAKKMVAVGSETPDALHNTFRGTPREARSRVSVQERFRDFTLVSVTISHGQRHQIRAHLAAIDFPICSDSVYLPPSLRDRCLSIIPRHALHAWKAHFPHPATNVRLSLEAPLPPDFENALAQLRAPCIAETSSKS
jgi:23S rRNA pseudouridine1911/1915/1917 synthase